MYCKNNSSLDNAENGRSNFYLATLLLGTVINHQPPITRPRYTLVQNNQESGHEYWATRLLVYRFVSSLAYSLTPEHVGKWIIRCPDIRLFWTIAGLHPIPYFCLSLTVCHRRSLRKFLSSWHLISVCILQTRFHLNPHWDVIASENQELFYF